MMPRQTPPITDAELALGAAINGLECSLRRLRDGYGLEADDSDVLVIAQSLELATSTRDQLRRERGA